MTGVASCIFFLAFIWVLFHTSHNKCINLRLWVGIAETHAFAISRNLPGTRINATFLPKKYCKRSTWSQHGQNQTLVLHISIQAHHPMHHTTHILWWPYLILKDASCVWDLKSSKIEKSKPPVRIKRSIDTQILVDFMSIFLISIVQIANEYRTFTSDYVI
jgi:hypothetical protein